jgi:hypothetical protein
MSSSARLCLLSLLVACAGRATPPTPTPAPDAAPVPATTCTADARHCCSADGRLVVPGGCQPSYPHDVEPATERGVDGSCVRIPCYLKCLPADARVRTPEGERAIATLAVGDLVYSADCDGRPRVVPIERVSRTPAGPGATILSLVLADGRRVRASPAHPSATGVRLDALAVGAWLDGSRVRRVEAVALVGEATHDILPAGPTGTYWVDGVLLGSTLGAAGSRCTTSGARR